MPWSSATDMRRLGFALALLAACRDTPAPPPAAAITAVSLIAPRADDRDVVVAQVNGRPVWGSCVAAQASRGSTREVAVRECIDFELLAQAAEHRGLAADREVVDAARTAMVSQLIATQFEDRYRTPADLGDRFDKLITQNLWRMHRPEMRASTYARIVVADKAPADVDSRAREIAEQIEHELATETGLFNTHLVDAAKRIASANGLKPCADEQQDPRPEAKLRACLDYSDYRASTVDMLNERYAAALFSIPEVGRIAPVQRTKWGWDVVLWTGGSPAKESTREALVAEVFPELRRSYFATWVNQRIKELGLKIELDPDQVARLDQETP